MGNDHEPTATRHSESILCERVVRIGPVIPSDSPKTVAASLNEIPCLRKFLAFFFGSHSNSTSKTYQLLSSLESYHKCQTFAVSVQHARSMNGLTLWVRGDVRAPFSIPYELIIHPEVTVNEAVPHPSYRTPLNLRMRCAELLRQILHGLADNFQAAHKGTAAVSHPPRSARSSNPHSDRAGINFYENMAQIVMRLGGHRLPRLGCAAQ
jgi:hypothetical protein